MEYSESYSKSVIWELRVQEFRVVQLCEQSSSTSVRKDWRRNAYPRRGSIVDRNLFLQGWFNSISLVSQASLWSTHANLRVRSRYTYNAHIPFSSFNCIECIMQNYPQVKHLNTDTETFIDICNKIGPMINCVFKKCYRKSNKFKNQS